MNNLAKVFSRAELGLEAPIVAIETHISAGLPGFIIVGMPEIAVRESKERVRSAIINSGFKFPNGKITTYLAPANLPKKGGRYDLAIALSILLASKQIISQKDLTDLEFYGELGLDGLLNNIDGLFSAIIKAKSDKKSAIVPSKSDNNLGIINNCQILLAQNLLEVCGFLINNNNLPNIIYKAPKLQKSTIDLSEVKGQFLAKRALEIAAAGKHNLLFSGSPGSGKTMLAERITTIMPDISFAEKLEVMAIYSIANINTGGDFASLSENIVFRAPHHLSSAVSLVGGGADPKPGEISLAHNGVLFLDELPEFSRAVLEVLRQPLESGFINISRAKNQVSYPANFQLIAAQNLCPCGYFGDKTSRCHCTNEQIYRYQNKVSGPFLDRIDMKVSVSALNKNEIINNDNTAEKSAIVKQRVLKAYKKQIDRQGVVNSKLNGDVLEKVTNLNQEQKQLLANAIEKLNLSTRSYYKILKVARTIADLNPENEIKITNKSLIEAISYHR